MSDPSVPSPAPSPAPAPAAAGASASTRPPKARFRPNSLVVGAWLVIAALFTILPRLLGPKPLTELDVSETAGAYIALLLMPTVLALLAFYLARRSNRAATVTFVIVALLVSAGLAPPLLAIPKQKRLKEEQRLWQEIRQLTDQLKVFRADDDPAAQEPIFAKRQSKLAEVAKLLPRDEADALRYTAEWNEKTFTRQRDYQALINRIMTEGGFELKPGQPIESLTTRLTLLDQAREQHKSFAHASLAELSARHRAGLKARGTSDQVIATYLVGQTKAADPRVFQANQLERELLDLATTRLTILRDHFDDLTFSPTGQLVFGAATPPDIIETYNRGANRLREIAAEQERLTAEMASGPSPSHAEPPATDSSTPSTASSDATPADPSASSPTSQAPTPAPSPATPDAAPESPQARSARLTQAYGTEYVDRVTRLRAQYDQYLAQFKQAGGYTLEPEHEYESLQTRLDLLDQALQTYNQILAPNLDAHIAEIRQTLTDRGVTADHIEAVVRSFTGSVDARSYQYADLERELLRLGHARLTYLHDYFDFIQFSRDGQLMVTANASGEPLDEYNAAVGRCNQIIQAQAELSAAMAADAAAKSKAPAAAPPN